MRNFYDKALIGLLCLVTASFLIGYLCADRSDLRLPLTPVGDSALAWRVETGTDGDNGGQSRIAIIDDKSSLSFKFTISPKAAHPYAGLALVFRDRAGKTALVDLSRYTAISFNTKCGPANVLALGVQTFDPKISVLGDYLTYRTPSAFFSCNESWNRVELDLTRLETPQWWFDMFKLNLAKQAYTLDKVPKINFGSTFQSPVDTASGVELTDITLRGRDWRYLYLFGAFMAVAWGGYGFWFFRQHTRAVINEVRERIQRDRPLVAYQQLSVELHVDKEKSAILRFMATEYANPEQDLDAMVAATGINRNKINEILKAELGHTFSAYLNKLRLTEAARLLAEKEDANVAEIAYSVGYKNVSYFNKLFKEEYGCTPRTFRSMEPST